MVLMHAPINTHSWIHTIRNDKRKQQKNMRQEIPDECEYDCVCVCARELTIIFLSISSRTEGMLDFQRFMLLPINRYIKFIILLFALPKKKRHFMTIGMSVIRTTTLA